MRGINNLRYRKIFFFSVLISVGVLIYALNCYYPLFAEDWDYSFCWNPQSDDPNRISSFSDIIKSQYLHYQYWGGRTIAHILAHILLWIGPGWHDLLNTLAFVALCFTIYRLVNMQGGIKISLFILIFIVFYLSQPTFIINTIWLTYSCNYMWTLLIVILFIYPYCSFYLLGKAIESNALVNLLFLFGGIISGWSTENMSITLIFFIIMIIGMMKFLEGYKIPIYIYIGLAGAIIGCLLLYLAPGNYVRLESSHPYDIFSVDGFVVSSKKIIRFFQNALLIPSVIFFVLLFIYNKQNKDLNKKQKRNIAILFYVSSLIGLIAFFPIAATVGWHAFYGIIGMAIIAVFILYSNINWGRYLGSIFVLILLIPFSMTYKADLEGCQYIHSFWSNRLESLNEQKAKGIEDIVFDDDLGYISIYGVYDFSPISDFWLNKMYARFYCVNSVVKKRVE